MLVQIIVSIRLFASARSKPSYFSVNLETRMTEIASWHFIHKISTDKKGCMSYSSGGAFQHIQQISIAGNTVVYQVCQNIYSISIPVERDEAFIY